MKLITAIVRPEKLSAVLEALFEADVRGLTISRGQGHGGETEQVETYRGSTVKMELVDKVRLEIGVSDPYVQVTVDAILRSARTGEVGDGKIFVLPVEKVIRIRTGDEDLAAVTPALPDHRASGGRPLPPIRPATCTRPRAGSCQRWPQNRDLRWARLRAVEVRRSGANAPRPDSPPACLVRPAHAIRTYPGASHPWSNDTPPTPQLSTPTTSRAACARATSPGAGCWLPS